MKLNYSLPPIKQTFTNWNHQDIYDLLEQNITKRHIQIPYATSMKKTKTSQPSSVFDDRIDTTANKDAFISLKDHKPNFANKPTCRPINPTKSEIGKMSKEILNRINSKFTKANRFNKWKNTTSVIRCFKANDNKQKHNFICFDIIEFYPSISQDLLNKALKFPSAYDNITKDE